MNEINIRKIKKIPAFSPASEKITKFYRAIPGIMLISHGICAILVQIFWTGDVNSIFTGLKQGIFGYLMSVILMQGFCILVPMIFIVLFIKIPIEAVMGKPAFYAGHLIMAATVGVPAAFVFTGLNNGFVYLMSIAKISLPQSNLLPQVTLPGKYGLILSVLLAVLLPGIIEELMFRGIIQGAMQEQGGKFSAIFFSAVAFSLFHADPLFIVAPFLAGLLLGFLRYKSNSVYPPIITHVSMNLTLLLSKPLLPKLTSEYFSTIHSNTELYASLLAGALAMTALLPMLIVYSASEWKIPAQKKSVVVFPFDYKFVIGLLILISTLLFVYFTSII